MKQKNSKFRLLFPLTLLLLLLFSCQTEEDVIIENDKNQYTFKKLSQKEIQQNKELNIKFDQIQKLKESNLRNKMVYDSLNNFSINTQEVIYIMKENFHSYTLPVYRNQNSNSLENLVIMFYSSGETKTFLINYNKTYEELNSMNLQQIQQNNVDYSLIDFDTNLILSNNNATARNHNICIESYSYEYGVPCNDGELTGGENFCYGWVLESMSCFNMGGGSDTGYTDSQPSSTSSDSEGGGGGSSSNSSSNENSDNEIITTPVHCPGGCITVEEEVEEPKTPCGQLQKMSTTTLNKNALTDLATKTGLGKESGYWITKNNYTKGYNSPIIATASLADPNRVNMIVGGNNIGAFHTHPIDTDDWVPMFSDGDLNYLFMVAISHNNNGQPKNYSEYFLTMTVPEGTFAIKIKNVTQFFQFMNNGLWKNNGELKLLQNKYSKRSPTAEITNFQKDLLNLFQELNAGVGLYKASDDLSSWSELILDPNNPNGNPIKQPCN